MKTRIAVAVTALVLGVAPISSAMAYNPSAWTGFTPYGLETTGSFERPFGGLSNRNPATCSVNPAAEGNARQQNFPVQQYGQTTGGNRC